MKKVFYYLTWSLFSAFLARVLVSVENDGLMKNFSSSGSILFRKESDLTKQTPVKKKKRKKKKSEHKNVCI